MAGYADGRAAESYALIPTAIGVCGLAWSNSGLTRLLLPDGSEADTNARLRRRGATLAQDAVPDHVSNAIASLADYFAGERVDFSDAVLDLTALTTFDAAIYNALRGIGWGRTTTYGALAATVGDRNAARAVGVAMSRNPWPIIVPCHRVLAANGAMGGFSAYGGTMTKQKLLTLEGGGLGMLPLFGP